MSFDYQSPNADLTQGSMIACEACNKEIHSSAPTCPHCGVQRRASRYKNKTVAAIFAFFLGGFGAHRFYLGQWWGIFYLFLFWLWIPALIALGEFLYFLVRDQKKWDDKYNNGIPAGPNEKSGGGLIVAVVVGVFFFIFIIGILASIAFPAYSDYKIRAKLIEGHVVADSLRREVESYEAVNSQWPSSIDDIGQTNKILPDSVKSVEIDNGVIFIVPNDDLNLEGAIIYSPSKSGDEIIWDCKESTIKSKYLPQDCR